MIKVPSRVKLTNLPYRCRPNTHTSQYCQQRQVSSLSERHVRRPVPHYVTGYVGSVVSHGALHLGGSSPGYYKFRLKLFSLDMLEP